MVKTLDLRLSRRGFDSQSFLFQLTTLGKMYIHALCFSHQAVSINTGQRLMSDDWKGNRRFGVALAMHHRHKWFIDRLEA